MSTDNTETENKIVLLGRNKSPLTSSQSEIESCKAALRPATAEEITTLMMALAAVYGAPEGWNLGLGIYVSCFAAIPLDVLSGAVETHIKTSKWFPKPVEILELTEQEMIRRRANLDRALEDPEWPLWLEQTWGPKPEGPLKRAAAIAAKKGE